MSQAARRPRVAAPPPPLPQGHSPGGLDALPPFHIPDQLPRPAEIWQHHHATQFALSAAVVAVVLVALALLVLFIGASWLLQHWLLTSALVALVSYVHLSALITLRRRMRVPIQRATVDDCAGHDPRVLYELFAALGGSCRGAGPPSLYVVAAEPRVANAWTVNMLLLGKLIKPLRAVYVTRPLLALLDRQEVAAVLAHELAHFHGAMQLTQRLYTVLVACIAVFTLAVIKSLAPYLEIDEAGDLLLWIIAACSWVVLKGLQAIGERIKYGHEFLADFEAAQRVGYVPMSNALLKLDQRAELDSEILARVLDLAEGHPNWDTHAIMERICERLPSGPVVFAEVAPSLQRAFAAILRDPPLTSQGAQKTVRRAQQALRAELKQLQAWGRIPWLAFDDRITDRKLDEQELARYLRALAEQPDALVARSPGELEGRAGKLPDTHPRTRRRIMFLAREFLLPRLEQEQRATGG